MTYIGTGANEDRPLNKIIVWDLERNQKSADLIFAAEVMDVRLRRDCLIAVLQRKVYVYSL